MSDQTEQQEWRKKTIQYVESVNNFVERGLAQGWENAGDEPTDPGRDHLAVAAISAVRKANSVGQVDSLRNLWPPAHAPLIGLLEKNGQSIPVVCVLPDDSILMRLGTPYETGRTLRVVGDVVDLDTCWQRGKSQ